jgi:hypothetical protein
MILSKQIFKNSLRGLRISGLAGLSALLITGGFVYNNLYAATITPTDYNMSELTSTLYRQAPTGYVKPSYTYKVSEYSTKTTANELSAVDAAEIMSQEIYRYFKVDITGKTIELSHGVGKTSTKPSWHGTLQMDSLCTIRMNIDSVTGELSFIKREILKPITSDSPQTIDAIKQTITRNLDINCKKVEALIVASNYLPEKIKSVTYNTSRGLTRFEGEIGKEKEIGELIAHIFNVTTVSDKTYEFTISEDLTRIDGIYTPEYVAQMNATINSVKQQNNQ